MKGKSKEKGRCMPTVLILLKFPSLRSSSVIFTNISLVRSILNTLSCREEDILFGPYKIFHFNILSVKLHRNEKIAGRQLVALATGRPDVIELLFKL